jgi:hypothetical protein
LETPSFASALLTCVLTVSGETNNFAAISGLRRPAATRPTTLSSVGVRLFHPVDGRRRGPLPRAAYAAASASVMAEPSPQAASMASGACSR